MPRQEYSIETRSFIVAWHLAGWSQRKIAQSFDPVVPRATVESIIHKYKQKETVENAKRSGRPSKLSERDSNALKHIALKNRRMPIKGINKELSTAVSVSDITARRKLHEQGFKRCRAAKKPFISDINAKKRLEWCQARKNWDLEKWSKIIWSDECSVEVKGTSKRVFVWRKPGERFLPDCLTPTFKSGRVSIMMWGCFIGNRLGPLVMTPTGRMNSEKYTEFLENSFLSFWDHLDYGTILAQDNAPIHTSKHTKDWLQEHDINCIEWPAQSPDLNPIENVWAILKTAVEARSPSNIDELLQVLKKEWEKIDGKVLMNLVNSMPSRINAVLKAKGKPTKY